MKPRSDLITDASGGQLKKKGLSYLAHRLTGASTYTYEVGYNPNLGVVTRALGGRKGVQEFMSVDPLASSYPMLTPYQFASNTPIMAVDLDGLEAEVKVNQIGKNSRGKLYVISSYDLTPRGATQNGRSFKQYADQRKYGTRGRLTVNEYVDPVMIGQHNGVNVSVKQTESIEISIRDRFANFTENLSAPDGGVEFTLEWGQGQETRVSENADLGGDIGPLLSITSMANATRSNLSPNKYGAHNLDVLVVDLVNRLNGQADVVSTIANESAVDQQLPNASLIIVDSVCTGCGETIKNGSVHKNGSDNVSFIVKTRDDNKTDTIDIDEKN